MSDLYRFEAPIVAHYSGDGITKAALWHAASGQWREKLRAKGYTLEDCFADPRPSPIPPMSAWASKNWPWLFVTVLLLWARENARKGVEARVWEWVEATLEEQLRGGRWMDSEAFSRIYLMHQLSPVVCLYREQNDPHPYGEGIRLDLHAWIATAATALALTSYGGRSSVIGARSVSDPPAHLHHWVGDKILKALRGGTNPYEGDDLTSRAHRLMWGPFMVDRAMTFSVLEMEKRIPSLPGVLGVWELYRYETGVLWVCRDTAGLAVDSTDPGLAGWSGEATWEANGGSWSDDDVCFWWAGEDGRRGGGRNYKTAVSEGADSVHIAVPGDELSDFTLFSPGDLLYRLRWDSSGCRRIDGQDSTESGTDLPWEPVDWGSLIASGEIGKPFADPDDEAVRQVLRRIVVTGGHSAEILRDIEAFLAIGAGGPLTDEEEEDVQLGHSLRRLFLDYGLDLTVAK